jgi:hypothetical protein
MFLKIVLTTLFLTSLNAAEYKWSLQITDPTYEVKNIPLSDKFYQAYMKKTGWRCSVSELKKNSHSHFRNINCDFSKYKAGRVSSVLSCSENRAYGELILDLYDERKDITFKLMLLCEVKK